MILTPENFFFYSSDLIKMQIYCNEKKQIEYLLALPWYLCVGI